MRSKKQLIFFEENKDRAIYVIDDGRFRWLTFSDQFVQTIINKKKLHLPFLKYLPAMMLSLHNQPPKQILILGCGGGAIVHHLSFYTPQHKMKLIESDKTIIEIAARFFQLSQQVVHADAFQYIQTEKRYDHVMVDIFIDNAIPVQLFNTDFFYQCKNSIKESLIINLVAQSISDIAPLMQHIREVFNNQTLCIIIKNQSNIICHAFKNKEQLEDVLRRTEAAIETPRYHNQLGLLSQVRHKKSHLKHC